MDVAQWRKDLRPAGKYKTEIADQLAVGLVGSQFHRNAAECPAFLDEVLEYACINVKTTPKGSTLSESYQANADLFADHVLTRDDIEDSTSAIDEDRIRRFTFDELKQICSKPSRDFIRIVALTMAKHFGKVKSRWIWEIQEALGRNVHEYDKDRPPEYRNSLDKQIINYVIADLFEK